MQKLNDLEWLDALTGQGDRHHNNYHIDIARDGTVTLKGVDNDQCLGKAFRDPDQVIKHKSSSSGKEKVAGHNVGLPSLISRSLANTIKGLDFARDIAPDMGDLLTRDEAAVARMRGAFSGAEELIVAAEAARADGRLGPRERLVVVDSEREGRRFARVEVGSDEGAIAWCRAADPVVEALVGLST